MATICDVLLHRFGFSGTSQNAKMLSFTRSVWGALGHFLGELVRPEHCEPRHDTTSTVTVRPAKTQISLGIRPV